MNKKKGIYQSDNTGTSCSSALVIRKMQMKIRRKYFRVI